MKKLVLFSCLAFVLSFGVVWGQEFSPQGPSLELKLENIVVVDNKIDGKVTAKNISAKPVNNVALSFTLWEGLKIEKKFIDGAMRDVFVDRSIILTGKKDDSVFSLLPGEEKATSFTLPYSSRLESGEYRLAARVIGIGAVSIFGEASRNVDLEGDNQFLKINYDTCRVIRGDKEYFVKAGPNFYPGEKPKVSCEITNPTNKDISAIAQFDIAVFSTFDSLQYSPSRTKGAVVNFPAKTTKKASFEIDSPQEPQVYEAGLRFIDAAGQAVSPYAFFRWVIAGPSARIENIIADKTFYQKGDIAKVKVEFFGSMDLFWRNLDESVKTSIASGVPQELLSGTPLENPVLALQIKDAKGNLCGQAEQAISDKIDQSGLQTKEFAVSIQKTCQDPKFSVSFKEAGKVLTSLDYQTISSVSEKQAAKQTAFGTKKITYLIAGLIILVVLLVLFIRKKRPLSPVLLILILTAAAFGLSAISRQNVLADTGEDRYIPVPWGQARSIGPEGMGYIFASINSRISEPGLTSYATWFIHHHNSVQSSWNPGAPVGFSFYAKANAQNLNGCSNYVWNPSQIKLLTRVDVYLNEGLRQSYFYENSAISPASISQSHDFGALPPGNYKIKTIAKNIASSKFEDYSNFNYFQYSPPVAVLDIFNRVLGCGWYEGSPCNNTDQNFSWANSLQVIRYSNFTVIGGPTLSFSANPTSITQGQSSTLTWSSQNANSCGISNVGGVNTSGSASVSPSSSTTYTLNCSGPGGSATRSATVNVTVLQPTASLSTGSSQIIQGQSSTISWSSSNATSCSIDQGVGGVSTSGSVSISPSSNTTYTLSCSGPGGSASQSQTITVIPVPTLSFSANPTQIVQGQSTTLTWSSSNASSCSASGAWSGSKAASGSQAITIASPGSKTYVLTCSGPGGNVARSVTVNATAKPKVEEI